MSIDGLMASSATRTRPGFVSAAVFLLICVPAMTVIGFCTGGLVVRRLFGSMGGHGLGDLGYLFGGALVGLVAGLVVATFGLLRWPAERRLRVGLGLVGVAVLSAIAAVAADQLGRW